MDLHAAVKGRLRGHAEWFWLTWGTNSEFRGVPQGELIGQLGRDVMLKGLHQGVAVTFRAARK